MCSLYAVLGVSLSTISKSTVLVNPDIPEAKKLRSWYVTARRLFAPHPSFGLVTMFSHYDIFVNRYDSEGKESSMAPVNAGMSPSTKSGSRSMYSDRISLSHITKNPSLGEDKVFYHDELVFW